MSTTAEVPTGIVIRAQQDGDAPALAAIRNDPRARWGTLATPFETVESAKKRAAMEPGRTELVACVDGKVVGMAGIFRKPQARRAHVAEIGIMIRDEWQGKGIGTKLFAALTELADQWLNLRRLELSVYTDNAPAIALYRKFGFDIEATEVADTFRAGWFADSYVMARLVGELPRDVAPYPVRAASARKINGQGGFVLRAAEPDDADAITDIMLQPLVRHGTLRAPFTTAKENLILAAPADPATKSVVAVAGGMVIGIAILVPGKGRRRHVGEIALLAVHDEWHGNGVGAALMAAMVDIADNWLNLTRMQLGVVADNAPAIGLYRKFDFESEGLKRAEVFRAGAYADTMLMARRVRK